MNQVKKSSKKLLSLFLAFILSIALVVTFSATNFNAYAASNEQVYEDKVYCNATIDEDFDDSSVIVVLDKNISEINKVHNDSFFGNIDKESITDLSRRSENFEEISDNFRQTFEIKMLANSKENILSTIKSLEKIDGIKYAGPNYISETAAETSDTFSILQWGLNGSNGINAPSAWNYTTGSHNVRVGIIDSGVAPHPDLNANLVSGWNFVDDNNNTTDTHGHGTHVAGIVGAVGNNSTGVSGVNWNISLVPLKVTNGINVSLAHTISAINYATNNNVDIINFSIGGYANNYAQQNAIESFPGVFVCAAGNDNNNNDNNPLYPSSHALSNLISVGSIDIGGSKRSTSNYGATSVDLFAPGGDIYSTYINSSYEFMSGTSMAAPHVTGVAALLLSYRQGLSPEQIKTAILNSVVKVPSLANLCVSGGRLNASDALANVIGEQHSINYISNYVTFTGQFTAYTNEVITFTVKPNFEYFGYTPVVKVNGGSPLKPKSSGLSPLLDIVSLTTDMNMDNIAFITKTTDTETVTYDYKQMATSISTFSNEIMPTAIKPNTYTYEINVTRDCVITVDAMTAPPPPSTTYTIDFDANPYFRFYPYGNNQNYTGLLVIDNSLARASVTKGYSLNVVLDLKVAASAIPSNARLSINGSLRPIQNGEIINLYSSSNMVVKLVYV